MIAKHRVQKDLVWGHPFHAPEVVGSGHMSVPGRFNSFIKWRVKRRRVLCSNDGQFYCFNLDTRDIYLFCCYRNI